MDKRKIYFILGISGIGKTSAAVKLAEILSIPFLETDDIFKDVGDKLGYERYDFLFDYNFNKNFVNFEKYKREVIEEKLSEEKYSGDLILDGYSLCFQENLDYFINYFKDCELIFLKINANFDDWRKFIYKKFNKNVYIDEYQKLYSQFKSIKITSDFVFEFKNWEQIPIGYNLYQKIGFTDIKFERAKLSEKIKDKVILDLGCNDGLLGEICLNNGAKKVIGIDNSWRCLYEAKKRGIETILMDLNSQEFADYKEKVDTIICFSTFHYIKEKQEFIKILSEKCNHLIIECPIAQGEELETKEYIQKITPFTTNQCFIPTKNLMEYWIFKYFNSVKILGESIPPDNSYRLIFEARKF